MFASSMMHRYEITIRDVVFAIWKRKIQVFAIAMLVFLAVAVVTFTTTKSYVSDASIFVRLGPENSRLDVTTTLGQSPGVVVPLHRESEINSVAELISSRELLNSLVDHFGADLIVNEGVIEEESASSSGGGLLTSLKRNLVELGILNDLSLREKAIIKMQKRLWAGPVKKSNVIRVEYTSYAPEFSQRFLNELVTRYVAYHAKINRPHGASKFLQSQFENVQSSLQQQEAELDQLKLDSLLFASEDQRRLLAERIANLEQQLDDNVALGEANRSEVAALRKRLAELPETKSLSTTTGAGNEGVDGMRQQFYDLQIEYERILAEYTPDHPLALQVARQLKKAEAILEMVEQQRTESVSGPNQVYDDIRTELIRKESLLSAVESKITAIKNSLMVLRGQLDEFVRNDRRHTQLSRQIEVNELTYKNYANNLEQARIDQALKDERLSNLSIAQAATFNERPSSPNKKLNLAAGLLLGLVIGCSFAIVRECFAFRPSPAWNEREAQALPIVARVPRIESLAVNGQQDED